MCRKLRLLGLCLFSVIRHRGRRDTEKNQALKSNIKSRLTRITQNRGQRFFSLRSNEVSTGSGSDRVSPRSGRQHKAWGEAQRNPRIKSPKTIEPAKRRQRSQLPNVNRDDSTIGRSAGFIYFQRRFLGFRFAPPQALCCHPLRGLSSRHARFGYFQRRSPTAHCSPLTLFDLRDACGRAVSLPAVDAYAQSRRLQPVLRASETAAPPASVQKLRLRRVCLFSVIRHRGTETQRKTKH